MTDQGLLWLALLGIVGLALWVGFEVFGVLPIPDMRVYDV